jgi:hypothetical protein
MNLSFKFIFLNFKLDIINCNTGRFIQSVIDYQTVITADITQYYYIT